MERRAPRYHVVGDNRSRRTPIDVNAATGVVGGIVGALQIMAGHIQYAVYSQVLWWLYLAVRLTSRSCRRVLVVHPLRALAGLSLLAALPLVLAAAQLFPALEYAAFSVRRGAGPGFSEGHAFPPWQLSTLVAPGLFGGGSSPYWGHGYFWEGVLCVGASVLPLCVASMWHRQRGRVVALGAVAVLSLALALGPHTPCFRLATILLPALGIFRGPAKAIFGTSLALSLLAGLGTSVIFEAVAQARTRRAGSPRFEMASSPKAMKPIMIGLAALGLALCLTGWIAKGSGLGDSGWWGTLVREYAEEARLRGAANLPRPEELPKAFGTAAQSVAVSGVAMVLALAALALATKRRRLGGLLLLAIVLLELMSYGSGFLTSFDSRRCHLPEKARAFLRASGPCRVVAPEIGLLNRGLSDRVATIDGFDAIMPTRSARVLGKACDGPVRFVVSASRINEVTRLLNARFALYSNSAKPPASMVCRARTEQYSIWEDTAAHDRAFFESTRSSNWTVPKLRYRPHVVSVQIAPPSGAPDRGVLVIGDTHYPGWRAYVDGERSTVSLSHDLLRSVVVKPKSRLAVFAYQPQSFRLGAAVSLLVAAGLAFCLPLLAIRRRALPQSSPETYP